VPAGKQTNSSDERPQQSEKQFKFQEKYKKEYDLYSLGLLKKPCKAQK
jgi:hypothetical protein